MIKKYKKSGGFIFINTMIFASISISFIVVFTIWSATSIKATRKLLAKEQAFSIAEAGIDYYRWHLAHASTDYKDGTNSSGPYVHNFIDKDGNVIGQYSLTITAPVTGSTLVTIVSKGTVTSDSTVYRKIKTQLAIPSFAKYAVVANDDMRFGEGTIVYGPVHSNGGIRFDGLSYNLITSAKTSYDDPDHTGANEFGVHTHIKPPPLSGTYSGFVSAEAPNSSVPSRTDVFIAGRQFPVPQADFAGITSDLSQIKTDATSGGKYLGPSGGLGYHIVFKTNDTYDVYKVTNLASLSSGCSNSQNQTGWGSWSIKSSNGQTFIANYTNPANGLIFAEDDVWVDGQINSARITLAAGKFPDVVSQRKNITINNDLTYTNYDGQDSIGLIAQNNINVGEVSDNDLRIDSALMAQNGRVGRYYYGGNCSPYDVRSTLTMYGMIGSNVRYGFAYTDDTGYTTRNIIYDANLLYGPPPSFPLTSDKYTTVSWEEIQ